MFGWKKKYYELLNSKDVVFTENKLIEIAKDIQHNRNNTDVLKKRIRELENLLLAKERQCKEYIEKLNKIKGLI